MPWPHRMGKGGRPEAKRSRWHGRGVMAGFKTTRAFQPRAIKQNRVLSGHAVQGSHAEHRFGGHSRVLHGRRVCSWLQAQAKQWLVRGHLDHQTQSLQLLHLTRSGGIQRREGHAVGGHVQQGNALTQHGKGGLRLASRRRRLSSRVSPSGTEVCQARALGSSN